MLGLGDAFTFISVLRLVPHWFNERQIPLVTQLTGICGQLGQVLSAIPFLALLGGAGWSTAYLSVDRLRCAVRGAGAGADPRHPARPGSAATLDQRARNARRTSRRYGCDPARRLGFFTHMGTQFSVTMFALMWGVPYLTEAQGLSRGVAGALLTVSVAAAISSGIVIGIFTGRHPHRRSRVVLCIIVSNALIWTVVLALPSPGAAVAAGGAHRGDLGRRTRVDGRIRLRPDVQPAPDARHGDQGIVNMGGFIASLLVMQAMGMIIGAAGGYSFSSFRLAWSVQYVVWIVAAVAILITTQEGPPDHRRHRREPATCWSSSTNANSRADACSARTQRVVDYACPPRWCVRSFPSIQTCS